LFLIENPNQVAADFEKLLWVFFNLCQSTELLKLVASLFVHHFSRPVGIVSDSCPSREIVSVRRILHGKVRFVNGFADAGDSQIGMVYTAPHDSRKNRAANCHFVIKQNLDGKPQIIVERYHQTISVLNNTVLGFDLRKADGRNWHG
jgi:hypothetical protein